MSNSASQPTQWRRDNPERAREITRDSYHRHRAKRREAAKGFKLRKYGITVAEHEAMRLRQNNACAICLTSFSPATDPCVDHCHRTNKVRGLLCRQCNLAIGNAKDCPTVLRLAANYVEKGGTQDL